MSRQHLRHVFVVALAALLFGAFGGLTAGYAASHSTPILPPTSIQVVPSSDGTAIDVYAAGLASLSNSASALLTAYEPIGPTSYEPGHTDYTPGTGVYRFTFDGVTQPGRAGPAMTAAIRAAAGATTYVLGATDFVRYFLPVTGTHTFASADNGARLEAPEAALGTSRYLVIGDTAAPPADPPPGHWRVSRPYAIRASDTAVSVASLALELDVRLYLLGDADKHTVSMFFWDEAGQRWEDMESEPWGVYNTTHAQSIRRLGIYELLAGTTWRDTFKDNSGLASTDSCAHVELSYGRLLLEDGSVEGCALSRPITPTEAAFAGWQRAGYTGTAPDGAQLTVDVLDADGALLLPDVSDGASLAALDRAAHPSLRLRANLRRGAAGQSPVLDRWEVTWQPEEGGPPTRMYLPLLLRQPSAPPQQAMLAPDHGVAETWVPTAFDSGDVDALAVDPSNPNTVYATVGSSFGWGVRKTTDGGASWPIVYSGSPSYAVAVDPQHPLTVYAGASYHAMKSLNGGTTWVELPDLAPNYVSALAIDPVNTMAVYAGVAHGWGVYKTTNGGARWQEVLTHTHPNVLAVDPATPATIYVGTRDYYDNPGGVLKSVNGGATWTRVMTNTQVNALALDPEHEDVLYAGTEDDGIFKSEDGGARWRQVNRGLAHPIVRALVIDPIHPQVLYAGTWEGGVYKSNDCGESWAPFNDGLDNTYIYSLALDPLKARTLYAGTHGNGVFKVTVLPPPPQPGETYVTVTDEQGQPVEGAQIYRNGELVLKEDSNPLETNWVGNAVLKDVAVGDHLVASLPLHTEPAGRDAHGGWAYKVEKTSLSIGEDGVVRGHEVVALGQQRLQVAAPLVRFNLVVSFLWNAEYDRLEQMRAAVSQAADYLFDVTDGQMTLGRVDIYDDAEHWEDADIQVLGRDVRPYAYMNGLLSSDPGLVMRIGRGWDHEQHTTGRWDASDGYRTIIHELGHYALGLYDSYYGYKTGVDGVLQRDDSVGCTRWPGSLTADDPAGATIMNWQYETSELSDRDVPGLWSDMCLETAQWQETHPHQSDWEAVAGRFGDQQQPPRWQITRPSARGYVLPGPDGLPRDLLALPQIEVHANPLPAPVRIVTVVGASGRPEPEAKVMLEVVRDGVLMTLDEGWTGGDGRIDVLGAADNTTITAMTADGRMHGRASVGSALAVTLQLEAMPGRRLADAEEVNPHLSIIPSQGGKEFDVILRGIAPKGRVSALVIPPGNFTAGQTATLSDRETPGVYTGRVQFAVSNTGMGIIQATGLDGVGQSFAVDSHFHLGRVNTAAEQDFYSPDGHAWLHVGPDVFATAGAYVALMATGAVPQPLPAGFIALGDAYSLRASDATQLAGGAVLQMSGDSTQAPVAVAPSALRVAVWNTESGTWQLLASTPVFGQLAASAPVSRFGIYVLLASIETHYTYLPLLMVQ